MRKLLLGSALMLASFTIQAQQVEIQPTGPLKVNVGDSVTVDIVGSGFTTSVLGGGFDLSYASTPANGVVTLGSAANVTLAAPPWDASFPRTETVDDAAAKLSNFSFNQFAGVTGSFNIAQLTFTVAKAGPATLALSASNLFPFADSNGALAVSFGPHVIINVVPEPTTWALLSGGLGLVGLWFGRRRQAASDA